MKHTILILALLALCSCKTTSPPALSEQEISGDDLPEQVVKGTMKEGDVPPRAISIIKPEYPADLKERGIEGTVIVEFIVDVNGTVTRARAISSPHPELSELVLGAISRAKFEPGQREGKPAKVMTRLSMTFNIANN